MTLNAGICSRISLICTENSEAIGGAPFDRYDFYASNDATTIAGKGRGHLRSLSSRSVQFGRFLRPEFHYPHRGQKRLLGIGW